jgi:hypothetical protein
MNTLDELEKLLKAGTKGPWETKQNKAGNTTIGPVGYSGFITPWVCDDENAALIVAAINALPGLLTICNAAKTALGHLDDPTGGDEINDMRRASDVLRAALKEKP